MGVEELGWGLGLEVGGGELGLGGGCGGGD